MCLYVLIIQQAREMVLANRRVVIDEVACSLQISHVSAYQIIHDELRFHKLSARWVPRELTAEHKRKRVEICQRLPDRYNNEGEEVLSRIVTGDETWVHHYEPESKGKVWGGNTRDRQRRRNSRLNLRGER